MNKKTKLQIVQILNNLSITLKKKINNFLTPLSEAHINTTLTRNKALGQEGLILRSLRPWDLPMWKVIMMFRGGRNSQRANLHHIVISTNQHLFLTSPQLKNPLRNRKSLRKKKRIHKHWNSNPIELRHLAWKIRGKLLDHFQMSKGCLKSTMCLRKTVGTRCSLVWWRKTEISVPTCSTKSPERRSPLKVSLLMMKEILVWTMVKKHM